MKKNPYRVAVLRACNRLNSFDRHHITVGDLMGIADDLATGLVTVNDIDRLLAACVMSNRAVRRSPEPTDDFNREYEIAPWSFDN